MLIIIGLVACAASSFCFGSMYVAVRSYGNPGDGMVVQWIVCSAIFLTGLVTYIAIGSPPFFPFAMIGGILWALGNLTALPIMNIIGLGMGILIWGAVNCVVGWATGRFGLFGVKASIPNSPNMNYAGLVLVIIGGVIFALIRPKPNQDVNNDQSRLNSPHNAIRRDEENQITEESETLMEQHLEQVIAERAEVIHPEISVTSQQSQITLRITAIILSILAGICYGSTFTPVIYIQDNPEKFNNPPKDAIYYVFSHFTGIYLTSTIFLIIYISYKQNKPFFDNRLIFPSLLAGVLWAVAMLAWFVANDILSQAITFPINAMLPGVIASCWSVFYFKEIESKDYRLLITAMSVTIFGVTLVGFSKMF